MSGANGDKVRAIITLIQPEFFPASAISAVLGTVAAYARFGVLNGFLFLVTLVGLLCMHAGVNSANEYFDFKSGADVAVKVATRYGGGTKVLTSGRLSPLHAYAVALVFLTAGSIIGIYLVEVVGNGVLLLGLAGATLGYFYTAPPLKLAYRGLGELFVGSAFGPLMVLGSFYVQASQFTLESLIISFPLGLLNGAAIVSHRYPDLEPDTKVGKNTIVVLLGKKRSSMIFSALYISAYLPIPLGTIIGILPPLTLITLITLPFAIKGSMDFMRSHADLALVERVGGQSMRLIIATGFLLSLGYVITGMGLL